MSGMNFDASTTAGLGIKIMPTGANWMVEVWDSGNRVQSRKMTNRDEAEAYKNYLLSAKALKRA